MEADPNRQLINLHNKLETGLRERLGVPPGDRIAHAKLLKKWTQQSPFGHELGSHLFAFNSLRNAIVHITPEGQEDQPIATPLTSEVLRYKSLVSMVLHPPPALDTIAIRREDIHAARWTSPLSQVLGPMLEQGYRLAPILTADGCVEGVFDLLHISALALQPSPDGLQLPADATLESLREIILKPDYQTSEYAKKTLNLEEAIQMYQDAISQQRLLTAILITEDGSHSGELLGLVTAYDLPGVNPTQATRVFGNPSAMPAQL